MMRKAYENISGSYDRQLIDFRTVELWESTEPPEDNRLRSYYGC